MAALTSPTPTDPLFLSPAFGTMERDPGAEDQGPVLVAIKAALEAGFRHLDVAELYKTNPQVGEALLEAAVPREELWVTAKLEGLPVGDYAAVAERVRALLATTQAGHFDLLLIHHPLAQGADLGGDPSALATPEQWEWCKAHLAEAWANMSRLVDEGLARRVGVSNFNAPCLDELATHAAAPGQAPIFANQIFLDAAHPQTELVALMAERGVRAMAYRPLAFVAVYGMLEGVGDALQAKADAAGAAGTHDLVLKWLLARGIVPVTNSLDPAHIAANLAAKDVLSNPSQAAELAACDVLTPALAEQAEMIDMYGGTDEYAAAFGSLGIAG